MELSKRGLHNRTEWEEKGYHLPSYDREKMIGATRENPFWVHFGAGNIFRAFQAETVQMLLERGILDRGLVAVEGFDYEIIEKMYRPHDDLSILVTLKADGTVEKTVVGSIAESCMLDAENLEEFGRLKEIFAKDSLQMVSFTITEKGYSITDEKGRLLPAVEADFSAGPHGAGSYLGKVTALLYERYKAGEKPVAMVSMDNCSHNGDKLYEAVTAFAKEWRKRELAEDGFVTYLNSGRVSFPWTMIDKITPRPDPCVEAMLRADGIDDLEPVITARNTYAAPFVNAEECGYLVVEDAFPNGRPALEMGGILFTDRETVDKVEKMKVCTCLNPLHTALAIFGCLLGYQKISEEMKDPELRRLVELIGYKEGLPVVEDPDILDPEEFLRTVLEIRFPNPFMPDTPQRIATDTSRKLGIRFGGTIKAYAAAPEREPGELKMIPLVLAGWLRYLMGVDDEGREFPLSPDPLLDTLRPHFADLRLGEAGDVSQAVRPILENREIFGVDLYEVGLAEDICRYFSEMTAGPGAVRDVLKKYTADTTIKGEEEWKQRRER